MTDTAAFLSAERVFRFKRMQNDGNIFKDSNRQKERHEDFSIAIRKNQDKYRDPNTPLLAKGAVDINVQKIKEAYDPLIQKPPVSSLFSCFQFCSWSSLLASSRRPLSSSLAVHPQSVAESEELLDILDWDDTDLVAFLLEDWQ